MNSHPTLLTSLTASTARLAFSPIPVSAGTETDVRALSDHENRIHFFDRFAKEAPKPAAARVNGAN